MTGKNSYYARAITRTGHQTKTQSRYGDHLARLKVAGMIANYWPEPFNIRLADGAYYKPDFLVQQNDGVLEIHEVKGAVGVIEDKSIIKAKIVASTLPFRMIISWPVKSGGWEYRNFSDELNLNRC